MNRPSRAWQIFPVLTRYTGLGGVLFVAAVWFFTDRLNPTLLAAFGGMMGIGEGLDALKDLVQSTRAGGAPKVDPESPPPPPERREEAPA